MMRRFHRASLLLFILAAACLSGQDKADLTETSRRLMLVVRQSGTAGFSAEELTLIPRSMLLALREVRGDLVLLEPARAAADSSDEEMSRLAGESGADCWMLVEISSAKDGSVFRVRSRDLLNGSAVIDRTVSRQGREELSVMTLPNERWEDLSVLLTGAYPPRETADLPKRGPGSALLAVRALPGTTVSLSGGVKATVGPDGRAELTIPVPAAYTLRAALRGSSTVGRPLYLQADRELAIQQEPVPRFALDVSALLTWPGFAVSFFPVPERVFVRAGLTTYLLGLTFSSEAIISSDPLTNLDLLAGVYMSPAYSALRAYAGVGGFVRFVHAPGWPVHLDTLSPAGLQAAFGLETPIGGSARFFAEYEPMLYATQVPDLLRSTQRSEAGWVFLDTAALHLLSFRIGMRWLR